MGPNLNIPSRKFPFQHKDDNTSNSDDSIEIGNENHCQFSYMFFTPTLEDLKNFLYVALNPYFEEFEIEVVSCPCLTKAPYKLAAAGLSGNTGILEMGNIYNFYPRLQADSAFDIKDMLSRCSYDTFVIGSGFVAKPAMRLNGHLTMNAVVSANRTNIINNSCVAYMNEVDELKLISINDRNQIKCCLFGQFFFSGGKRGPVIKMRAKGRRSRSNIIALIQAALTNLCQDKPLFGLGIVLVINGGQTFQFILPYDYVIYFHNRDDYYYGRLIRYNSKCKNLIALGSLIGKKSWILKDDNERMFLRDDYSQFNAFFNCDSAGEFLNDDTPEETEYIVYINIAQERCLYS